MLKKNKSQPCDRKYILHHAKKQKKKTYSDQLRQLTDTLMRLELILHNRKCRSHRTSREISRQSVKAHCEENRIATSP
jgi:hypothetical protein